VVVVVVVVVVLLLRCVHFVLSPSFFLPSFLASVARVRGLL